MYELLLALAVVLFAVVKGREHFYYRADVNSIIPVQKEGDTLPSFDTERHPKLFIDDPESNVGTHLASTYPDTCADDLERSGLICYPPCRDGYTGDGPICRANTTSVGIGKAVGLEPCPAGWSNDGLTCREPIRCASGWDFFKKGCSGGRVRGRLNGGGICDWPSDRGNLPNWLVDKSGKEWKATHPDKVDGLCYKKCPADKPVRVPGMPYLCYKGGPLLYGRGVGEVPCGVRLFGRCLF